LKKIGQGAGARRAAPHGDLRISNHMMITRSSRIRS
jgi:hypothetical protein